MPLRIATTGLVIGPGMELPMPAEEAAAEARTRLATLDVSGAGLGELARIVVFAAGAQARPSPLPWRRPRLLLLHGDHAGGAAAGSLPGESARRAEAARAGAGALAELATRSGAELHVVEAPASEAIEQEPALGAADVEAALAYGWQLAEEAIVSGVDTLVIGACGTGTEAAAAAVLAATAGAEPAAVLPRAVVPGARVDDNAWMVRCAAVRDALHRIRRGPRAAHDVLAELGGGDIAIATGVLLGATARRTPVLLDGPVGVAACLVSRDLAGQARHWCLLPDHGRSPLVRLAADVLGLPQFTDLRLDLGEGATALAALPLLTSALAVAAALPTHPALVEPPHAGDPAAGGEPDGA
jgi:nicotinate-nucleotide--dimethylbenzimidazole phosphoribosyltransferase